MIGDISLQLHNSSCVGVASALEEISDLLQRLCPQEKITYDGFVNYEGWRLGVHYRYVKNSPCSEKWFLFYISSDDIKELLATHDVTWSRRDQYRYAQYASSQPKEFPTMLARVRIELKEMLPDTAFNKFDFDM